MHHNVNLKINVILASEFESVYRNENTTWNEAFEKAIATKEAIDEIESLIVNEPDALLEKIEHILEKLR